MNSRERQRLQRLIDATVATQREFQKANDALCSYCLDAYGFTPGDRDVDEIIDAVQGGCGPARGMRAEDFDAAMRRPI